MKYFILQKNELKQVSAEIYEQWLIENKDELTVEPSTYNSGIGGKDRYHMQSQYFGAFDEHEEVLPFILFTYIVNEDDSIGELYKTEYFHSLEEMNEVYWENNDDY